MNYWKWHEATESRFNMWQDIVYTVSTFDKRQTTLHPVVWPFTGLRYVVSECCHIWVFFYFSYSYTKVVIGLFFSSFQTCPNIGLRTSSRPWIIRFTAAQEDWKFFNYSFILNVSSHLIVLWKTIRIRLNIFSQYTEKTNARLWVWVVIYLYLPEPMFNQLYFIRPATKITALREYISSADACQNTVVMRVQRRRWFTTITGAAPLKAHLIIVIIIQTIKVTTVSH